MALVIAYSILSRAWRVAGEEGMRIIDQWALRTDNR
jgi:hypothetical protein